MKKALKIILILAIVVAVGFLGLVAIYFIQKKPVYYTSYENAGRYTAGSTTLEAGAVDEIDISWLSGTVRFRKAAGSAVTVSEDGTGLTDRQQVRWWLDGRTLRIQYWASGYGTDNDPDKTLVLEIPDGISVSLEGKKGAVILGDHDLKDLSLKMKTADITAGSLTLENDFVLENGGGETDIRGLTARNARFNTLLGEVRINTASVEDSLEMKSGYAQLQVGTVRGGSVKITGYRGIRLGLGKCESVALDTNTGDIAITVRNGAGATVDFDTGSGARMNGKRVEYTARTVIGDGSCSVKVDADSGDLTVTAE